MKMTTAFALAACLAATTAFADDATPGTARTAAEKVSTQDSAMPCFSWCYEPEPTSTIPPYPAWGLLGVVIAVTVGGGGSSTTTTN